MLNYVKTWKDKAMLKFKIKYTAFTRKHIYVKNVSNSKNTEKDKHQYSA